MIGRWHVHGKRNGNVHGRLLYHSRCHGPVPNQVILDRFQQFAQPCASLLFLSLSDLFLEAAKLAANFFHPAGQFAFLVGEGAGALVSFVDSEIDEGSFAI